MPSERPGGDHPEVGLLRGAVDKTDAMLAYWDSAQRCRFANRAYERWFGISPEALIGTHLRDLLGPIYELNRPHIEAALRGELQQFERELPDPAGGPARHSLATYTPDFVDGVVRGFYVLVVDISAVKHAQLALAASEARFAGIIAIAADAIICIDEAQRITIFNAAAERIFGYARAEVIGRELGLLLPERLRDAHRRHLAAFIAGHETARHVGDRATTIFGVRKGGEEFVAEAAISKLEVDNTPLLTVVLRDITDRRRTELEQQILAEAGVVLASSLDYKQTLRSIGELVVRHVAELCVIDMLEDDDRVLRLTVAHADPTKAAACAALARLSLAPIHTLAGSALATKQPQVFDDMTPEFLAAITQDEDHLRALRDIAPRSAIVVPLLSANEVLGALVLASSRPHHFGARDVGLATELARRAAIAVENARLYEAAQRATRARDDVLGIVAHDVRSPLNAIFLSAQLLARKLVKAGDAAGRDSVESILRSIARANHLIEDLLDVARIEGGALSLAPESVAVEAVLGEVLGSQQLLASAVAVELQVAIDPAGSRVRADRHRLLQVLENLIGNALKLTPTGGLIRIEVTPRAGEVRFAVADTGPGIPAQNLTHVFDRFWQAQRAERTGAGLGLAICKGIVEAHGGRIWVESTPGCGSTFFFTLPTDEGSSSSPAPGSPRP